MTMDFTFTLTQHDWSLHRKGKRDQERHRERVDEAIKDNLADIIADESIITSNGRKIVKVPVRSLDEYRFRHDHSDGDQVGQGPGDSQVGDVIGQGDKQQPANDQEAGDQPGEEYYEAYVDIEQLAQMVFEDLGLPDLQDKYVQELLSDAVEFQDIRRKGPFSNLDKRRTIRENIKRNAQQGNAHFGNITDDDLRYKTYQETIRTESNAVIFAMMDVSGSMGTFEKYICRSFFWWMTYFLRDRYSNVEIVFISHHTQARVVTEREFFGRGESGGTMASSAYELLAQLIAEQYPPAAWNIYPFHFTDGDNFGSDNTKCLELVQQILPSCNQMGYGEIRSNRPSWASFTITSSSTTASLNSTPVESALMKEFKKINDPRFVSVTITEKADVWTALRTFFAKKGAEAA